jgi:hypothetical protein
MVQHNTASTAYHYRSVRVDNSVAVAFNDIQSATTASETMSSGAISHALLSPEPANKKRTHEELGNHDDDDYDSDKSTLSGLAAFFHYAQANQTQVRVALGVKATFGKVAEELAKNYKALVAAEISKWQDIAGASNVDFIKEMKPYSAPTKTRKKKDPDAPKGPVSAYFHYMMAIRTKILADDPNMAFGDVTKECAIRFKAMTDADKKEWEEKAVADKVRYKSQMETYEKEQEAKKKSQEKAGDENEDGHEDGVKSNKKAKKTPAQEHDKEKTQAKEDGPEEAENPKKKTKKAKKTPPQEHEDKTTESAGNEKEDAPKESDKPKKKNKKKTLTEEQNDKPKKKEKRPVDAPAWFKSGYTLYMEANRGTIQKANAGMAHSEVSKLGSVNFKALPDKKQQKWKDMAAADKARFDKEMEVYNSKQEGGKKDEVYII